MSQFTGSLNNESHGEIAWIARTILGNIVKSARYFVALMKQAAARERARKQLAQLDARMLQDIGLEPFDVYFGWRGQGR